MAAQRPGLTQALDLLMTKIRPSKVELVVAGTVLLLHFVAITLIIRMISQKEPVEAADDVLVVHWIHPTLPVNKVLNQPSKLVRGQAKSTIPRIKDASIAATQKSDQSAATEPRQLILSAPELKVGFERNPLAHHEQLDATPIRMKVTIIDRSFFGTLQRMTQAQICKDLRAALSKTVGDATTIVTTMQKNGCIRT